MNLFKIPQNKGTQTEDASCPAPMVNCKEEALEDVELKLSNGFSPAPAANNTQDPADETEPRFQRGRGRTRVAEVVYRMRLRSQRNMRK